MAKRVSWAGLREEMSREKTLYVLEALGISPFAEHGTGLVYIGVGDPRLTHERVKEAERTYLDSPGGDLANEVRPVAFRNWASTDDRVKATYFQRVIREQVDEQVDEQVGFEGYALNVNLAPETVDQAVAASSTFMKTTQERVARHFKTRVDRPVDFWFRLEVSPGGRPHLHGAFSAQPIEAPLIKEALEAASRARGMQTAKRAVVIKQITDAAGWARYSTKTGQRARALFECKTITATSELRRRAQQHYERDQEAYRTVAHADLLDELM